MSIEALKQAAANLDDERRRELLSFLVGLREQRWAAQAQALSGKLDDSSPELWLTMDEFKARLEEIPAPEA